jgi:hypothetical protein
MVDNLGLKIIFFFICKKITYLMDDLLNSIIFISIKLCFLVDFRI